VMFHGSEIGRRADGGMSNRKLKYLYGDIQGDLNCSPCDNISRPRESRDAGGCCVPVMGAVGCAGPAR
jgi:hypothetical protein